jgi:hypothetical protein
MSTITLGDITLDDTYAPLVNVSFEYFKTKGGEIIGGLQKFNITGVVTVADQTGLVTGSNVMTKLKNIRNIGKKTKCANVVIPGFYSGLAKITNVSIDQGSDPTWVNQGDFSIEVSAPLTSIPTNSLGITLNDSVTDISKSETIEIGEDAHGYVLTDTKINNVSLSKTFVKFSTKIDLTCKPLCPNLGGVNANPISILKRMVSSGPTHEALQKYKSWKPFLQSRSLDISTEGTVSFSSEVILLPPNASAKAFIDIGFEHNRTYESKQTTKKISGTVTGLAEIAWSDLVTISDTSSSSKLVNAEAAFSTLKSQFTDISNWSGLMLELIEIPGCPKKSSTSIGQCGQEDDDEGGGDVVPTTSSISKDRTEGVINFNFEWSSEDGDQECSESNGKRTEVTVDIVEPQATIVEHVIPGVGTLMQNLNCRSAKQITFTSTTTDPQGDGCSQTNQCSADDAINKEIEKYVPKDNDAGWLLIENSRTTTTNSFSITKKYIRKCLPRRR